MNRVDSFSVAIVAPGRDTAVLYSNLTQRIEESVSVLSDSPVPSVNRMDDASRIVCRPCHIGYSRAK